MMHAASIRPASGGRRSCRGAHDHRQDRQSDAAALDIERGHLVLVSGSAHEGLARRIGNELDLRLGSIERLQRDDGEIYARYGESVRGAEVFLVQSCAPPTNDHLVELLVMAHAARLASASTITPSSRGIRTPGRTRLTSSASHCRRAWSPTCLAPPGSAES